MRILLIANTAEGIINLKETEHFVLNNITDFIQVIQELLRNQKSQYNFKYCTLEENSFIPFFMRVKNGLYNQMQTFSFERVKYSELNIDQEKKEEMIREMIMRNNVPEIKALEDKGLKLLLRKELGTKCEDDLIEIGEKIEILEKEIKNVDYQKYLNEFV